MTHTLDMGEIFGELEAMPGVLEAAARRLDRGRWSVPPPEGGFCLVEQAWHLADLEREGYGERIRRLLAEDDPLLADFDGDRMARERSYRTKALEEGIAAFAAARAANVALFRSLAPPFWDRMGRQEGVGPVALGDIPRMMREHDAAHRGEIAALLAAAKAHGSIVWTDLTVPDAEKIRDFYSAVVGWQSEAVSMGSYSDFSMVPPGGKNPVAGVCHARGANANLPAQWLVYVSVPNLDASIKRCVELGGKVIDGPRSMGEKKLCVIQDPAGAVAGLIGD